MLLSASTMNFKKKSDELIRWFSNRQFGLKCALFIPSGPLFCRGHGMNDWI